MSYIENEESIGAVDVVILTPMRYLAHIISWTWPIDLDEVEKNAVDCPRQYETQDAG